MKVISLNTWGAKAGIDGLLGFCERYRDSVDAFCFQEVWNGGEEFRGKKAARFTLEQFDSGMLEKMAEVLPDHQLYYRPHFAGIFGLAAFVRVPSVSEEGRVDIYKEDGYSSEENIAEHNRIMQFVTLGTPACTIAHLHGLWSSSGKIDTEDRLAQSEKVLSFLSALDHPYVLLGDFNLRPETESLKKLEAAGMRNLVAEHGIKTTRTSLYDNREREPHADYAFVSAGIEVKDFQVLPDEVSDHAPLYLEFDIA